MNRIELVETAVAIVSGVMAGVCFILLYFAVSAPVVETVLHAAS